MVHFNPVNVAGIRWSRRLCILTGTANTNVIERMAEEKQHIQYPICINPNKQFEPLNTMYSIIPI